MLKLLCILLFCTLLHGTATADPVIDSAIRSVVSELEDAVNQRNVTGILRLATDDIVMISKNGSIAVGKDRVASYLEKMIGIAPSLKGLHSSIHLQEPVVLLGNTAIVSGTSDDEYNFSDGLNFKISTIWGATLICKDSKWLIGRVHFSFNLFDNPLLRGAEYLFCIALGAGLFSGFASGSVYFWYSRRSRHMT